MRYVDSWICITFWLHAALGTRAHPQDDDTATPSNPSSIASAATLPDLILRTPEAPLASPPPPSISPRGRPRKNSTAPRVRKTTYVPKRLTDPPPTRAKSQTGTTYIPRRLDDPPGPRKPTTFKPEVTTYELSVTPVVIPPRKLKSAKSIRDDCVQFGLIPDLFDESPPNPMQVRFLFEFVPKFGNQLDPEDLIYRPYYVIWPNKKTHYYTLLMIDIDYPSRSDPYMRSYQHWLVVNIRGDDWIRAECWSEYLGPNPLYGTGLHRYVFLVLKQPKRLQFTELRYPQLRLDEHRANFSLSEFIKKYDLKPHAINFFQSQWMHDFVYPIEHTEKPEHLPLSPLDLSKHFGDITHF